MLNRFSNSLAQYLVKNGAEEDDLQVYAYGIECFLNLIICDCILLILAFFIHYVPEILIWDISYTLLRMNLGGFHASTHFRCISLSVLLGISSVLINPLWINFPYIIIPTIILCFTVAFFIAPVTDKKYLIPLKKRRKSRANSLFLILISGILSIILISTFPIYAGAILTGFVSAILLAIIGKFQRKVTK